MIPSPGPWYVDAEILTIFDATGTEVVSAAIGVSPRIHKLQVQTLRRIAASINFTRGLSTEGMERKGELDLVDALRLSLDSDEHFRSGPLGIVKGAGQ